MLDAMEQLNVPAEKPLRILSALNALGNPFGGYRRYNSFPRRGQSTVAWQWSRRWPTGGPLSRQSSPLRRSRRRARTRRIRSGATCTSNFDSWQESRDATMTPSTHERTPSWNRAPALRSWPGRPKRRSPWRTPRRSFLSAARSAPFQGSSGGSRTWNSTGGLGRSPS